MRSFILFGFLAMAAGFGAIEVSAQGKELRADIPFEFTVGKKTLPAGSYRITLPATAGASKVIFRSIQGDSVSIAMTQGVSAAREVPSGLVFFKTGDKLVLYRVFDGRDIGHEIASTKRLARAKIAKRTVVLKPGRV